MNSVGGLKCFPSTFVPFHICVSQNALLGRVFYFLAINCLNYFDPQYLIKISAKGSIVNNSLHSYKNVLKANTSYLETRKVLIRVKRRFAMKPFSGQNHEL